MRRPDFRKRAERREKILTVAAELFARRSFHEVLMDDVAYFAKVSKGSLYNYFANKEELYISIILDRMTSLLEQLKNRIDHKQTPLINLRRIIIHIYSFMCKYPHFFQIWYREKLRCDQTPYKEIRRTYTEIKQLLIRALERGMKEGILREHDTRFAADLILGVIDAAVLRAATHSLEQQRRERRQVYEFVLDALGTARAQEMHALGKDEPGVEEEETVVLKE